METFPGSVQILVSIFGDFIDILFETLLNPHHISTFPSPITQQVSEVDYSVTMLAIVLILGVWLSCFKFASEGDTCSGSFLPSPSKSYKYDV